MSHILKVLYSAMILLLPLVWSLQTEQVFEVNKYTLQSFFAASIAIIFAASLVFFPKKYNVRFSKILLLGSLFLLTVLFASAWFSATPIVAFFGGDNRHQGSLFLLTLFIFGCIASKIFSQEDIPKYIFAPLVAVGAILSVHAIIQWTGNFPIFADSGLNLSSVSKRPFATMGQPNFLAQTLLFSLAAAGFYFLHFLQIKKKPEALVVLALMGIFITAIIATGSRAVLLGVLALVFLVSAIFTSKYLGKKIFFGAITLVGIGLVGIFLMIYFSPSWLVEIAGERGRSILARHYFWQDGVMLLRDYLPVFGFGADNLSNIFREFGSQNLAVAENFTAVPGRAHSLWIDIPLHFGIPALFGFLVLVYSCVQQGLQKNYSLESSIIITAIIASLFSCTFGFFVTTDATFFAVFLGLLCIGNTKEKNISTVSRFAKWIFACVLIIFVLVTFTVSLRTWTADKAYYELKTKNYSTEEEQNLLWEKISAAPWLQDRLTSSAPLISDNQYSEFLKISQQYKYSSGQLSQLQIIDALQSDDREKAREIFNTAYKKTGYDIREKIPFLVVFQKYMGTPDESLLLAKDIYSTIPHRYFEKENFSEIFISKFWKDARFDSVYNVLYYIAESSLSSGRYCTELKDITEEFGFERELPDGCG